MVFGDEAALCIGQRSVTHAEWAGKTIKPDQLPDEIKTGIEYFKSFSQKYPDEVYYNNHGFPDFTPYAKELPGGAKSLKFDKNVLNGNMQHDMKLAEEKLEAMGLSKPEIAKNQDGATLHHVEGGQEVEFVPEDLHNAYKHSGGRATMKAGDWFTRTGAVAITGAATMIAPNTLQAASAGDIPRDVVHDLTQDTPIGGSIQAAGDTVDAAAKSVENNYLAPIRNGATNDAANNGTIAGKNKELNDLNAQIDKANGN